MRKHHSGYRLKSRAKLVLILLVLIFFLIYLDSGMRSVIRTVSSAKANRIGTEIIQSSVSEVIEKSKLDYEDLSQITYDENRHVTAIEVDSVKLNLVRGEITKEIAAEIEKLDTTELGIPLGTLFGNEFLAARGPKIPLKMYPSGYLESQIVSQFDEAGINQTRHRILLNISVNISCTVPFYRTVSTIKSEFIMAETVIVGEVPEYFTKVVTEDRELLQNVNDYSLGQQQKAK